MIKLFYVNNINTKAQVARARQVSESYSAFNQKLGDSFKSFLPRDSLFTKFIESDSSKLRKIIFYLIFILKIITLDKKYLIYSRNLFLLDIAKKLGFKTIWESHGWPVGISEKVIKKLSQSSRFVVISNALKLKLSEVYHIPIENIFVVRNAIDITRYDQLRNKSKTELKEELNLPMNKKIIMHTGSIFRDRGVELFETVLSELEDYLFVQVGGHSSDVTYWKNRFSKYQNIMFIEHQEIDQLIKYQMSADLLFYMISKETSTYWCCSPMKAFEYLGSGVPIVASVIGSLSEIFNESNAVVYDPLDKNSLIEALNYVVSSEDRLLVKSEKAVEEVRNNFTWDLRANNIITFLENDSNN